MAPTKLILVGFFCLVAPAFGQSPATQSQGPTAMRILPRTAVDFPAPSPKAPPGMKNVAEIIGGPVGFGITIDGHQFSLESEGTWQNSFSALLSGRWLRDARLDESNRIIFAKHLVEVCLYRKVEANGTFQWFLVTENDAKGKEAIAAMHENFRLSFEAEKKRLEAKKAAPPSAEPMGASEVVKKEETKPAPVKVEVAEPKPAATKPVVAQEPAEPRTVAPETSTAKPSAPPEQPPKEPSPPTNNPPPSTTAPNKPAGPTPPPAVTSPPATAAVPKARPKPAPPPEPQPVFPAVDPEPEPPPPPKRRWATVPKLRAKSHGLNDLTELGVDRLRFTYRLDGIEIDDIDGDKPLLAALLSAMEGIDTPVLALNSTNYQLTRGNEKIEVIFGRHPLGAPESASAEALTAADTDTVNNAWGSNEYELLIMRRRGRRTTPSSSPPPPPTPIPVPPGNANDGEAPPTLRKFIDEQAGRKSKFDGLFSFIESKDKDFAARLKTIIDTTPTFVHQEIERFGPTEAVELTDFYWTDPHSIHIAGKKLNGEEGGADITMQANFTLMAALEVFLPASYPPEHRRISAGWFTAAIYPWTVEEAALRNSPVEADTFEKWKMQLAASPRSIRARQLLETMAATKMRVRQFYGDIDRGTVTGEIDGIMALVDRWANASRSLDKRRVFKQGAAVEDASFEIRGEFFEVIRSLHLETAPWREFAERLRLAIEARTLLETSNPSRADLEKFRGDVQRLVGQETERK